MKKRIIIIQLLLVWGSLLLSLAGFSQLQQYQFEQIDSLQKQEARNVVVFIHTDWCKYCKIMENGTFKNEEVVNELNEKFYFVDLNAEEKKDIHFSGNTFHFKPTGKNIGVHELAEALGSIDGEVSYPAIVVLNAKNEIVFQYASFLKAGKLKKILNGLSVLAQGVSRSKRK